MVICAILQADVMDGTLCCEPLSRPSSVVAGTALSAR